ncbi:MAG: GNAT family N-acetyltransferase [Anaerolineae bacterium]|nr:GNAT family N-acetyltransferase [Anaerolineae bacterium]
MTTIETPRLILRRLTPADMDAYYEAVFADPDVMRYLAARRPLPRDAFEARIPAMLMDHWEQHGFGPWVVIRKTDDRLIGHAGLRYWPDSTEVEVLYALTPSTWGQGLATEAARASLRYGFDTLNLERIIAAAFAENVASRRVLAKCGMREVGPFTWRELELVRYECERPPTAQSAG